MQYDYFFLTGDHLTLDIYGNSRPVWQASPLTDAPEFQGAMSFWDYWRGDAPRYCIAGPRGSGSPVFGIPMHENVLRFVIRRGLFLGTVNETEDGIDIWPTMEFMPRAVKQITDLIAPENLFVVRDGGNSNTTTICFRRDADFVAAKMLGSG